ncbi:MAG TPA: hypothetical protein PLP33_24550 [Leptospiraceae bacterium]|nr:hypothetical protein [Leptospiraceae bacterium]
MSGVNYNPYSHHSKEQGYQNLNNAKATAKFVKAQLKKIYGSALKKKSIAIYGVDNSTTYLAAHVKMLMPEIEFISGRKAENDDNDDHTGMRVGYALLPDVILFVDDYFSRGRASCQFAYAMQNKKNMGDECKPDMLFFFINSAYDNSEVKKKLESICQKYPISVFSMVER